MFLPKKKMSSKIYHTSVFLTGSAYVLFGFASSGVGYGILTTCAMLDGSYDE